MLYVHLHQDLDGENIWAFLMFKSRAAEIMCVIQPFSVPHIRPLTNRLWSLTPTCHLRALAAYQPPPPPPRWFTSEDTSHLTEVNQIASVTTPELLRSSCLSHTYTSDLRINTPEHLILLSQDCACFSSLDLLFSVLSFLLFFFFFFSLMNGLKKKKKDSKQLFFLIL